MTRVAAIDCGTNSIRLLVADVEGGVLRDLTREMRVVRLGQGVDRTGEFAAEALERTFTALDAYAEQIRDLGVERVRFVATSAARDARNRDVFLNGVRERIGVTPEVISGQEEASLSFRGVVSAVSDAPGPYLMVDLGGGSTELALGTGELEAAYSMDVGCVRLTERHLVSDPPTSEQQDSAVADVRAALSVATQTVPIGEAATLIGVAGSITTVTAHALKLDHYDPLAIHGATLSVEEVVNSCNALIAATYAERAAMPFMHPGRVEAIGAGALVWREVVTAVSQAVAASGRPLVTVTTSEHDILDGIALSIA